MEDNPISSQIIYISDKERTNYLLYHPTCERVHHRNMMNCET